MTAEIPKEVPVEESESGEPKRVSVHPYQKLLNHVFDEEIEFPPLSPDKEQALVETTNEVLATLSPRMQEVLVLRYGLSGQSGRPTLQEVGQLLDPPVGRERVRQLEAGALSRLRHPARSRKLEAFLPLPKESIARSIAGLDLLYGDLESVRGISFEQLGQLGELISHLTEGLRGSPFEIRNLASFLESDHSFVTDKNLPEPVVRWMAEELRKVYQDAQAGKYKVEQPEKVDKVTPETGPTQEGTPIDQLHLDNRITNTLKRNSIVTVEALIRLSREDLLGLVAIGPMAAEKIDAALISFYSRERPQTVLEAIRESTIRKHSEARRISDMVFELFANPNVIPADLHKLKALIEKLATTSSQPQP